VREFTQDDAHILCTPEQLDSEIKGVLDFVRDMMAIFKFNYDLEISTSLRIRSARGKTGNGLPGRSSARWKTPVCPTRSMKGMEPFTDPRLMSS
jgi:hypothetical protein